MVLGGIDVGGLVAAVSEEAAALAVSSDGVDFELTTDRIYFRSSSS